MKKYFYDPYCMFSNFYPIEKVINISYKFLKYATTFWTSLITFIIIIMNLSCIKSLKTALYTSQKQLIIFILCTTDFLMKACFLICKPQLFLSIKGSLKTKIITSKNKKYFKNISLRTPSFLHFSIHFPAIRSIFWAKKAQKDAATIGGKPQSLGFS